MTGGDGDGTAGAEGSRPPPPPLPEQPPPGGRRRRRRWPWLVAAAILAGAVAVGVAASQDEGPTPTVPVADAARPDVAYCEALDTDARAGVAVVVFLEAGTTDAELGGAERSLARVPGVSDVVAVDRDAAYAEAQDLFADSEQMRDVLEPEDLPLSIRFTAEDADAEEAAVAALDADLVVEVQESDPFEGTVLRLVRLAYDDLLAEAPDSDQAPSPLDDEVRAALVAGAPEAVAADVRAVLTALDAGDAVPPAGVEAAERILLDAATRCGLLP